MKDAIDSIPIELEEAAEIEGAFKIQYIILCNSSINKT